MEEAHPVFSTGNSSLTARTTSIPVGEYDSCQETKETRENPMDSSQSGAVDFAPDNIIGAKVVSAATLPLSEHYGLAFSPCVMISALSGILLISLACTFLIPVGNDDVPYPWKNVSAFIGWVYFCMWSISFIPQLIINFWRHSVLGQSIDFIALNIFGFSCLAIYTLFFYDFDFIKAAYASRHHGETSTVALNDVCFAIWALSAGILNAIQVKYYHKAANQVVSKKVKYGLIGLLVSTVVWWIVIVLFGSSETPVLNSLDFLYGLSYIKLGISCVKYIPQLYMNYRRQATDGWSIENVLCDFMGGTLSVVQQLMDSFFTKKTDGLLGNPVKFFLGSLSIVYDILFMIQHFILYKDNPTGGNASAN